MNTLPTIDSASHRVAATMVTEVIADPEAMLRLEPEWTALAALADCRASAGFSWALAGWKQVAAPRGGQLRIVTVRRDGALLGVWPLARYDTGRAAELHQLDSRTSDYVDILAIPGPSAVPVGQAAWRAATALGDVLILQFVQPGSLLEHVLRAQRRIATRDRYPASRISFAGFPLLDDYLATVNKERRVTLARYRRRLERQGRVEFALVDDAAERSELLDWILAQKQQWLDREGLDSISIGHTDYHAFLHELAAIAEPASPIRLFALRLDGAPLAGFIFSIDRTTLEFINMTNDPAWARFSPGSLLTLHCIAWAHAHGLDFDFRLGSQRYKMSWANRIDDVTQWHVALTPRGCIVVAKEALRLTGLRLRSRFRRGVGWVVGHMVKPWLLPLLSRARRIFAGSKET